MPHSAFSNARPVLALALRVRASSISPVRLGNQRRSRRMSAHSCRASAASASAAHAAHARRGPAEAAPRRRRAAALTDALELARPTRGLRMATQERLWQLC